MRSVESFMSKRGNSLKTKAEDEGLDRQFTVAADWEPLSGPDVLPYFPQLDDAKLRSLTVCVNQLIFLPAYVQKHLNNGR